ncbi:MAG: DUF302 domain-containing protein [Thermoplasmataceae archaeon]
MYSYEKDLDLDVEDVYGKLSHALKENGFIVLSYVDVQHILESNFGDKFRKYYILNVCKPIAAREVMAEDLRMGMFIPCKISIYETETGCHLSFLYVSALSRDYLGRESGVRKYEDEMVSIIDTIS